MLRELNQADTSMKIIDQLFLTQNIEPVVYPCHLF